MEKQNNRVVIIGGGISGLAAAYYIQQEFRKNHQPAEITLYEQSDQFGGKIQTMKRDGCVIERGPDSFLARKLPIIELTKELGLEGELVATNPRTRTSFILHEGRLHRMPPGLVLGIPTKLEPFFRSDLVSTRGKLRAAADLVLPKRTEPGDESLGDFLERRFGEEVVDRIAEPLLAGIYAGDTRKLSLQATFPQFHTVEQQYGSVIIGMNRNQQSAPPQTDLPEAVRGSIFLTYRGGLATLVDGLVQALDGVTLATNTGVTAINRSDDAANRSADAANHDSDAAVYELTLATGEKIEADAVILAVPSFAANQLLAPLTDTAALEQIRYVSVANVVFGFRREDTPGNWEGTGFVIPRNEGRRITACTWTSAKWPHASPESISLIRSYVGRAGEEERVDLSDEAMIALVREELEELMGITTEPLFNEVTRWYESMPQYPVGHPASMGEFRQRLDHDLPGVKVAGSAYDGVGIPDCIRSGRTAAMEIVDQLLNR